MKPILDRLILYVEDVKTDEFQAFSDALHGFEMNGRVLEVKSYHSFKMKDYKVNIDVGEGGGAIHIGWYHNSTHRQLNPDLKGVTLRLECNPSKVDEKRYRYFLDLFSKCFSYHHKKIKGIDIAWDIPRHMKNLMVDSLTGRERSIVKGTEYYGTRGKDGYFKKYDKKKEREKAGESIKQEELTRIEYSARFEAPLTIQELSGKDLELDKQYKVSYLDLDKLKIELKLFVIGVLSGEAQIKDFTRTNQKKIREALDSMKSVGLDESYTSARKEIVNAVKRFTIPRNIIEF